jgi:hypothetical protein
MRLQSLSPLATSTFAPAQELVEADAQALVETHGRNAYWIAREYQMGREPDLGRGYVHWREVVAFIAERHGLFGSDAN